MGDSSKYTVGWICAITTEYVAAKAFLDREHEILGHGSANDNNIYTLGEMGKHNVVIAQLPKGEYGIAAAAGVARHMVRSFSNIRISLMVGIGGGAPSEKHDIRLGDVVISAPRNGKGGLFQYDFGKTIQDQEFWTTGFLNQPPSLLRAAMGNIKAKYEMKGHQLDKMIKSELEKRPKLQKKYKRPDLSSDRLYQSYIIHPSNDERSCEVVCGDNKSKLVVRRDRSDEDDNPAIHYGLIASANQVMKNAVIRDRLAAEKDVLCFEMEAAGLMKHFPCLVIRGICDYSDSHKNKEWRGYAAMVAAAYAKDLLSRIPPNKVEAEKRISAVLSSVENIISVAREVREVHKTAQKTIATIEISDSDRRRKKVMAKLPYAEGATFDSSDEGLKPRCHPETRIDLLRQITEWAKDPQGKPIFWLKGMAGIGKSTIARTVAESFNNEGKLGASFFFKRREADWSSVAMLFTTICGQLLVKIPSLVTHVEMAIDVDSDISEKSIGEQFEKLICQPLSQIRDQLPQAPKLIIVIDALDECAQDGDILLRLLSQTRNKWSPSLQIFITSRPEQQIRSGFANVPEEICENIDLDEIPQPIIKQEITTFLKYRFTQIQEKYMKDGRPLPLNWPGLEAMSALVEMAFPLFSFAATLCRFIEDPAWLDPLGQLKKILEYRDVKSGSEMDKLDATYSPILNQLIHGRPEQIQILLVERFRRIVGTIIHLAEPISRLSLAYLLDINSQEIEAQLSSLHSVLSVPSSADSPIRILHLSFRDFLIDPHKRPMNPFWVDETEAHKMIMTKCLERMSRRGGLEENICSLPDHGILRAEINSRIIANHLPPDLQYACRFWVYHLKESQTHINDSDPVHIFIQEHFLHWLESLSLLGRIAESIHLVRTLQTVISDKDTEICRFLNDALQFIRKNISVIDQAPVQLYTSALIFTPKRSIIRNKYIDKIHNVVQKLPEVEPGWSAVLQTLQGHSGSVLAVAFSPDGKLVASGSGDKTVKLWNSATGTLRQMFNGHSDSVWAVAFSPDGKLVASGSGDKTVKLWDPTTGTLRRTLRDKYRSFMQLKAHSGSVLAVAFSPDGKMVASGSGDKTVKLWDLATGTLRQRLKGHSDWVRAVAFSPDGKLVASGSGDKTVKLWDIATGTLRQTLNGHSDSVWAVAFSPNGKLVASGSGDKTVKLWDLATGTLRQRLKGHSDWVRAVAFSPDGKLVASGSNDNTVKLWDPAVSTPQQTLEGHSDSVIAVAFSPDSELVASGSYDRTVKLWDPATGNLQQNPDIVQPPLEEGADVNTQDGHHGDENYRDYTITTESRYVSDQVFTAEQMTDFNTQSASLLEMEDLRTVYSDNFSVKSSTKAAYVDELVHELLTAISSFRIDSLSKRRVAEAMPDSLRAFSVRLSSSDSSQQVHRDVSAFIRKYKQDIIDAFLTESPSDPFSSPVSGTGDNMSLEEIMELWSNHGPNSEDDSSITRRLKAANNTVLPEEHNSNSGDYEAWSGSITESDTFPNREDANQALHSAMPELQTYRECIFESLAYDWLLSDLRRHCLLTPSGPDVMAEIGRAIMQILPSQPHISRQESLLPYKMLYYMDWDLVSFLEDQEYSEENFNALPLVITVTGSREAAQALTCSQYLHQIWPLSAGEIVNLIQTLLKSGTKDTTTGTLQDGTRLIAWFQSAKNSKECKIVVEVIGSAYSVTEVGQQLSWLGSALRSSPHPNRVTYCHPQVENFQVVDYKLQSTKYQYAAEVSADISFVIDKDSISHNTNGECWHDIFRNCVVVEGYPISKRPEMGATSGLEIPLPIVASLLQASYVNNFLGGLIIKGFSAMLVPTEIHNGLVVWHLEHNKNGDRISYLDNTAVPVKGLIAGQLSKARHILGWCSETRYLAGTRDAKYTVSGSRLPRAHGNGVLSQASISNGKIITGGEPFLIGYKDTPFHVSRAGYLSKLKWIFKKSVILWDEEAKRGWMLNGATALLHLVRASIVHDNTGPFSSECLFRWESLEERQPYSTHTPESAIAVLLNPANRAMTIYEGKDEHVTFEFRVKHFLNILEQIFDHQVHAVGPDANGYSSKFIPRAHFEGWDFHDLAIESDPLHPRLANIASKGKAWVDFTRSIHSINLLGRGFGEILEPSRLSCPYWGSLPQGQYYLAAGIADLKMVLESTGDLEANPIRLSENLVWYNPETVFEPCDCTDATADHADIVQVILPVTMLNNPEQCQDPVNLAQNGAVVFGYNRNFQWRWGDAGDPEREDDIKANDEDHFSSICEDGYDNSNTLSTESVCGQKQLSSTQDPMIEDTIVTSSDDKGYKRPRPLVRSYTMWNLRSLRAQHYTVGIICALPLELLAVRALFDQTHPDLSLSAADSNHYALGRIGRHKVVAACLPDGEYGTNSAADVASNLKRSFTSVQLCLLVGIGGGVPSSRNDIRLGDVVVSKPTKTSSGVIQYDMGKALDNGVFEQKGFLHPPPRLVMTALSNLKSDPWLPQAPLQDYIEEIAACRKEYRYPGPENDRLFSSMYVHNSKHATCDHCSGANVSMRAKRSDHYPRIHYGLVASGNSVMKDAKLRDKWSKERDILCFEMEAAGIMNTMPCLVIRGICDYSDSHKNDRFQEYAAATAASYAKLLLSYMKDSSDIDGMALHSAKDDQSLLGIFRRALPIFPSTPRNLNRV